MEYITLDGVFFQFHVLVFSIDETGLSIDEYD